MLDKDDVRRIAMEIPDVTSNEEGYAFGANEIGIAWPWKERIAPKKARVPNYGIYAVRVSGEEEKQAILASDPVKFFTEDHYNGYPAVLVRLAEITEGELRDLLTDARDIAMTKKKRSKRKAS
jgi:hypothetical protein